MPYRLHKIFVCSCSVIFFLLSWFKGHAQEKIIFERVGFSDELPVGKVNCSFKDKKGFLWLGTNNGLHRYDGKEFLTFSCNTNDPFSLPSSLISGISEDSQGRLWIATSEGLSVFYPGIKKFFTVYPFLNKARPAYEAAIKPVYIDAQDRVWFGTNDGLEMIDLPGNTRKFIPIYKGIEKRQRLSAISSIVPGKKDELWLATLEGIYSLNTKNFTWKRYVHPYVDPYFPTHNYVCDVSYVNDTLVWAGTWGGGLKSFNPRTNTFKMYRYSNLLPDNTGTVNVVLRTLPDHEKDGRYFVWICTGDTGLGKFYPDDESFVFYHTSETDITTIDENVVVHMIKDRDSIYWIGTNIGLNKIDLTRQRFSFIGIPGAEERPDITDIVTAFAEDTANAQVYVGTYYDGIYCWDRTYGTIKKINTLPGLEMGYVKSMVFTGSKLYIAANENYVYDPLVKRTTVQPRLSGFDVSHFLKDKNGFWVFNYKDPFFYFDPVKDSVYKPVWKDDTNKKLVENVAASYLGSDGRLWLGTGVNGMGVFDPKTSSLKTYRLGTKKRELIDIFGLTQDQQGIVWLSSDRQGLIRFDPRTEKFKQVSIAEGLPTDEVYGVQKDKNNRIWMISLKGLAVMDANTGRISCFNRSDGLENDMLLNGFMQLSDGLMLIGHRKGFNTIQSNDLFRNTKAPTVAITAFRINNRDFYYSGQQEIRLRYDQNNIQLRFAALNFSSPQKNRYVYMLEGADRQWTQPSGNNLVNYAALEPGEYIFRVIASNSDNMWTSAPLEIKLVILPPYWKTWWFRSLLVVLVMLVLYIAYRFRLRQLGKMQHIRNKIADDLHDEVGSALSSISLLSGMAKSSVVPHQQTMKKIEETSRETVENMSDIVWSIQPKNDKLTDVVKRMKNHGQQLFIPLGIAFEFNQQGEISQLPLSMEQRKNLYLIYKEALNNAAKYATAKNITVSIGCHAKKISLVISDNGKGFDTGSERDGNGLFTMQERARRLGGRLTVESREGKGTTISLVFKTA